MDGIGVISLITSCTWAARLAVRLCALRSCHTESKWQLNDLIGSKVILVECEHVTVDVAQRARLLLETEIHLGTLIKMVLNNKTILEIIYCDLFWTHDVTPMYFNAALLSVLEAAIAYSYSTKWLLFDR